MRNLRQLKSFKKKLKLFLNCHTFHSLRYGTLSVEELVRQASECGVRELVLTDINTVTAIYDFKKECEKLAEEILKLGTTSEVEEKLKEFNKKIV